nr:glycosyl transferase family 90 [Dysgonomonas sp. 520]
MDEKLASVADYDLEYINYRLNYYNRLEEKYTLPDEMAESLSGFKLENHRKVYFFDTFEYARYFPQDLQIIPLFGDIIHVPEYPSLVKSRPIEGDNANSVVLKLDKIRHFLFLNDKKSFKEKKDMLIFRGKVRQEHRIRFMDMYYNKSPRIDIGQVNITPDAKYPANRLTIGEQLDYKFILSIEGNDVASNLKWVMSSNSLAVMPKPKYETWFMEGTLIPDYHYVLIKDDYSDLEERMDYYIQNPDKAQQIIDNAHEYVNQFKNKEREDLLSLLVLKKYFQKTGQMP